MDCIEIDTRMQSFFSFTMPMIWFFSDTMTADWLFAVVESFIFWRRSIAFLCNPRDIFAADSAQSTSRFSSGFCAFKLWQFGFFVFKKFFKWKNSLGEKYTQGVRTGRLHLILVALYSAECKKLFPITTELTDCKKYTFFWHLKHNLVSKLTVLWFLCHRYPS